MNSSSTARLRPFRPVPFGRYTLLTQLATGGMGEIFLARLEGAQGFEKLCVIKKILPQLAEDPEFVERFVGEARTLVKLSHGSIAQVFDMGLHEGEAYMALEHVDGKDLRKVAARARDRNTPLPLSFVLFIMGRVLDALAYAHRKRGDDDTELNLVHRDISPQNILISYEGEVKVIDFGLAKSRLSAAKTNPSIILGKFLYMSPEQARHQPVDRRSDLYAVGLCLYELISGRNPFDSQSASDLMASVAQPQVPPLLQVEPMTPPAVAQLVMKALAVEPSQRFQSAEELRARLQACLLELDPNAGPENVSRFMLDLFTSDYQAERRLLASLKEVPRATEPESWLESQEAAGPRTAPLLPARTIQLEGPQPLSFKPTPRTREGGPVYEGETRPGVVVDETTRPGVTLEEIEEAERARAVKAAAGEQASPLGGEERRSTSATVEMPGLGAPVEEVTGPSITPTTTTMEEMPSLAAPPAPKASGAFPAVALRSSGGSGAPASGVPAVAVPRPGTVAPGAPGASAVPPAPPAPALKPTSAPLPASVPAGMLAAAALRSTGALPLSSAAPSAPAAAPVRPPPAAAPPAHAAPTIVVPSVDSMRASAAMPPAPAASLEESASLAGSFAPTVEMQVPTSVLRAAVPSTSEGEVGSWASALPPGPLPGARTPTDELRVPADAPRSALPVEESEGGRGSGAAQTGELPLAYGVVESPEEEVPIEMAEALIEDTDQSPKLSRSDDVPWERESEAPEDWDAPVAQGAELVTDPGKGPPAFPPDTDPRITVSKSLLEDTQPRVELPLNFLDDTQPRVVLDEKLLREEGRGEEPGAPVRASDVFESGAASASSAPRVSTTGKHRPLPAPSPVPATAAPRTPAVPRRDMPTPPAPTALPPRLQPPPRTGVGPPPVLRSGSDPDATNPLEEIIVPSSRDVTLRTAMPKRPTRTWVWVLMGLALMLAGAAGGAVIFFFQHPEEHVGPPPAVPIPPAPRRKPVSGTPAGKPAPAEPAPAPAPTSPESAAPESAAPAAVVPAVLTATPTLTPAVVPASGTQAAPPAEAAPSESAPAPAAASSPEDLELLAPLDEEPAGKPSSPRTAAFTRKVRQSVQKEWVQSQKLYKELTRTQSCEKLGGLCDQFYAMGKEVTAKKGEEDRELLVKVRKLRQDLGARLKKKGAS
jgi:serine/threonine protein kinase